MFNLFFSYEEQLFRAIENNDYQEVKNLITQGRVKNLSYHDDKRKKTPLSFAASKGRTSIVQLLIDRVSAQEIYIAIIEAIASGNVPTIQLLINQYENKIKNNKFKPPSILDLFFVSLSYVTNDEMLDLMLDYIHDAYREVTYNESKKRALIDALNNDAIAKRLIQFIIDEDQGGDILDIDLIKYAIHKLKHKQYVEQLIDKYPTHQDYFIFLREAVCNNTPSLVQFLAQRIKQLKIRVTRPVVYAINDALMCAYNYLDIASFTLIISYVNQLQLLNNILQDSIETHNEIIQDLIIQRFNDLGEKPAIPPELLSVIESKLAKPGKISRRRGVQNDITEDSFEPKRKTAHRNVVVSKEQQQFENENNADPLSAFDSVIACTNADPVCSLRDIIKDRAFATHVFINGAGCAHYKKGDAISAGLYGTIYYTCCNKDDCNHITKIIYLNDRQNPTKKEDFVNELRMHQRIAKLGIAPSIRKAYLSEENGIIVMEKMEMTLHEYIKKLIEDTSTDLEHQAYQLADQLANVIQKIHENGIFHGDLHNNNIMVNRIGRIKLIDFGRSFRISRDQMTTHPSIYFGDETAFDADEYRIIYFGGIKDSFDANLSFDNYDRLEVFDNAFMQRLKERRNNEFKQLRALSRY